MSGDKWVGGVAGWNYSGTITNAYNTGAVSGTNNVGGVAGNNDNGTIINALWANDLSYEPETGKSKPNGAVGNVDDSDTVKGTNLAEMKKAATYDSWTDASSNKIVAKIGNDHKTWRIYEGYTTPFLTSFFKGVVTVRGQSAKTVTYNGTVQTADTGGAVYSLADIDNSHIYLGGSGRNAGTYVLVYSDQQGYDLVNTNTLTINPKNLTATLTGKTGDTYAFTKIYDGKNSVTKELVLGTTYTFGADQIISGDTVRIADNDTGVYADNNVGDGKNAGDDKAITFNSITLTGADAGNYELLNIEMGITGAGITPKTLTGSLASGYSFDKVYDGTTTASLGNGYTLSGVAAGDKVPLTAAKGFYDSSAIGDRTVTFSGFSINNGNYLLSMADSLSGTGKITSGSQDRNYSDALTGVSSSFGANPSDGYTIFRGAPEDYVPRAVTKNNGQSYQVGVSQVTQTWYNGPATITIINGGITLPKDILLGSTPDTRTVVIKGGGSYEI